MRRIFLVLVYFATVAASSQNYFISSYDTVKYGNPGDLFLPSVTLTNSSPNLLSMMVRRIVRNIPSGWSSCFCFPYCVPQIQDTLFFSIPVANGKDTGSINVSPNFGADSVPGIGVVTVVITDLGTGQSDTVTYRAITTATSLDERTNSALMLYPNPCLDYIYITGVESDARIILYDGIGKDFSVDKPTGANMIHIQFLKPGIYIMTIVGADNRITSRRFVKSE